MFKVAAAGEDHLQHFMMISGVKTEHTAAPFSYVTVFMKAQKPPLKIHSILVCFN